MANLEKLIVLLKMLVLAAFAIAGLAFVDPGRLSASTYPPASHLFYSLAITFFAYEGFRIITNAAEDMPNPQKTLPRAIMTSILIVMVLYIAIALVVFGQLAPADVIAAKDFALARAAEPVFGPLGFRIVAVTALIATASSINASLYAVTNVTYQLAKNGELPQAFGKPIKKSREGLVISGLLIILIAVFLDLGEIAILGSVSILILHMITHVGHVRLIRKTGASALMVVGAVLVNLATIILVVRYESERSPHIVTLIAAFIIASFGVELLLRAAGKVVSLRVEAPELENKLKGWLRHFIH
jgi:amino acid transporter